MRPVFGVHIMFARDWECCFIELEGGIMTITEDLHMLLYVALGGALGSVGVILLPEAVKGVGGREFSLAHDCCQYAWLHFGWLFCGCIIR